MNPYLMIIVHDGFHYHSNTVSLRHDYINHITNFRYILKTSVTITISAERDLKSAYWFLPNPENACLLSAIGNINVCLLWNVLSGISSLNALLVLEGLKTLWIFRLTSRKCKVMFQVCDLMYWCSCSVTVFQDFSMYYVEYNSVFFKEKRL